MPWSTNDYPTSWKNLDTAVRSKAIEIGNALLDDGMEESRAIPIALSQARESLDEDESEAQWVVPHEDGWAVKTEGAEQPRKVHSTQRNAIEDATEFAKKHDTTVTVLGRDGTIRDRQSFRPRL